MLVVRGFMRAERTRAQDSFIFMHFRLLMLVLNRMLADDGCGGGQGQQRTVSIVRYNMSWRS
jgi:hypothetical protein